MILGRNGINIAKLVENAIMDNWLHGSAVRFKASYNKVPIRTVMGERFCQVNGPMVIKIPVAKYLKSTRIHLSEF